MNPGEVVRLKNPVSERDHACGPASAPVTLVQYGNFECLDCGRAYPVIKDIQKLLGDSLRFVFRHFPTVQTHPHSVRAAEASEAAAAQDKFWPMHDELFTHQLALADSNLSRYAKHIGLDTERFTREMTEHTYLKGIETGYERSVFDEHVTGTPTFYINGVRYTGATNVESFLPAIKDAAPEGSVQLPGPGGIRGVLERLRQREK